jgi:UDP-glucose 4-epimerase
MGESPPGKPNNLITCLCQVAIGRLPHLKVFGKDYDTPDGTGVRDYVHIMDLATGHLRALESLAKQRVIKVNLGTGHGSSVLEIIHAFSKACGKKIPYIFAPRRHGDVANCYACANMAYLNMGWRATRHLNDMCADAWRWQISNPSGYSSIVN